MPNIGFLGPQGSFSEEGLQEWLQKQNNLFDEPVTLRPYPSIPRLLWACDRSELDFAFVPLENSIDGQVGATLDTLNQTENLLIFREYIHPIHQCLLTLRPLPLHEINKVFSHEQALGQCREFLESKLPQAQQIICASTAEAAATLSAHDDYSAAIGPRQAAKLYSLHCLEDHIQDTTANATRFILVGHHLADLSDSDKTSLLFSTENSPGSLSAVLQELSQRGLNLTRIESRPSKQKLGEYIFFIDVDGYVFMPELQEALWALRQMEVRLKLLGSYPKYPYDMVF